MFYKKRFEELESKFEKLSSMQNEYEKQLKRIRRLERIVKYSNDSEPTFAFPNRWNSDDIYLYINKEEYVVEMVELRRIFNVSKQSLKVHNDRAYFTVTSKDDDVEKAYLFIIDYCNNRYVFNGEVEIKDELPCT